MAKSNVELGLSAIGAANRPKLDVSRRAHQDETMDRMGQGDAGRSYGDFVKQKTTEYNKGSKK